MKQLLSFPLIFTFLCGLYGCAALFKTKQNIDQQTPYVTSSDSIVLTPTPTFFPLPTYQPLPENIIDFQPQHHITLISYNNSLKKGLSRGIYVEITMPREDWEEKRELSLFVDDVKIPNDTLAIGDGLVGNGPFYISWAPEIGYGLHEACFEIINAEMEILGYCWYFDVIEP